MISGQNSVYFWNGNKSATRRRFEAELLSLCLNEAGMKNADLVISQRDYPNAQDEGNIFSGQCDVLVSVAGNQKFLGKPCIVIERRVCKGLLGHRLLVILKKDASRFATLDGIEQLQQMSVGVPATWADADLFRHNGFRVSEEGSLDNVFTRLLNQEVDYVALGANEVEALLEEFKPQSDSFLIEPTSLIYYPLPLVFYVHPKRKDLADIIENGLNIAIANGKHQRLFEKHHPNLVFRLGLLERKKVELVNPHLPSSLIE